MEQWEERGWGSTWRFEFITSRKKMKIEREHEADDIWPTHVELHDKLDVLNEHDTDQLRF